MSVQTLYTAATGMESLQQKLDVIANNLANVNTTAFKRSGSTSRTCSIATRCCPALRIPAGNLTPDGVAIGLGARVQSTQTDQTQGAFRKRQTSLDMAIQGDGYFQVTDPSGQILYTRAGNFSVNANGALVVGYGTIGRLAGSRPSRFRRTPRRFRSVRRDKFRCCKPGNTHVAASRRHPIGAVHQSAWASSAGRQHVQPTAASGPATQGVPERIGSARSSKTRWKPRTCSRCKN